MKHYKYPSRQKIKYSFLITKSYIYLLANEELVT